ncbi:hypothetical protein [Variovorax sp.]|uniref:hypothetical protein n=1 Tax=Variovorax sp. TaxID=1871043 RepID=UPI002D6E9EB8|nr:hypothetical protein [Variovorax sp.]HYP84609.1 hypothetical protein [Variovorax sp.]
MVTSLLIGFGCVFFILGHSTLLFFKSKELSVMPIQKAIFPWPKKGKFVSVLCLGLSAASIFLIFSLPPDNQYLTPSSAWKILSILAVFPSVIYISYLVKRIRKQPEGLLYFPSDAARHEWSLPIIVSVFISFLLWIFK